MEHTARQALAATVLRSHEQVTIALGECAGRFNAGEDNADQIIRTLDACGFVIVSKAATALAPDNIEALARSLHWKLEQLDPTQDPDWEQLNERQKDLYRLCIEHLLLQRELQSVVG